MQLYPKGKDDSCKGYVSLFLQHLTKSEITVKFSFSLLNELDTSVEAVIVEKNSFEFDGFGFSKFIKKSFIFDPKNSILNNNELKILCEIILKGSFVQDTKEKQFDENSHRLDGFDRFEKLLTNNEFSDLTIKAEEKTYHLHKCILTSCSDVFETMFNIDMKEKGQNLVKIKNIKSNVLDEFFLFIYTGKVRSMRGVITELLTVAEQYNVKSLKELCEEKMCESLNNCNALEYLKLGIINNAEKLRKQSINWISLDLEEFIQKSDFNDFGSKQPEILLEIIKNHFSL